MNAPIPHVGPAGHFSGSATAQSATSDALSDLSCAELQARITETDAEWQLAYARFLAVRNPDDREAALQLLHERDAALRERNRRIRDGEGCYFMEAGRAAGEAAIASKAGEHGH